MLLIYNIPRCNKMSMELSCPLPPNPPPKKKPNKQAKNKLSKNQKRQNFKHMDVYIYTQSVLT